MAINLVKNVFKQLQTLLSSKNLRRVDDYSLFVQSPGKPYIIIEAGLLMSSKIIKSALKGMQKCLKKLKNYTKKYLLIYI